MGTLIQQHTTAFTCPGSPPGATIVISLGAIPVGDDPNKPLGRTDGTAMYQLIHLLIQRVCPLVEHQCKDLAALFCGLVHNPYLLGVNTGRLLAEHVIALFEGFCSNHRVQIMGGGDNDGIADVVIQQLVIILVKGNITQPLTTPIQLSLVGVTDGSQFHTDDAAVGNVLCVGRAHIAYTNDGNP